MLKEYTLASLLIASIIVYIISGAVFYLIMTLAIGGYIFATLTDEDNEETTIE